MNPKIIEERLISFYSSWQNNKKYLWGNSDILVIYTPPSDTSPNRSHPISSSFFVWLLGREISDTIAVFTRDEIYFICTEEKFTILQNLNVTAKMAVCARVKVILKNKNESGLKTMDKIINWIRDTEKAWATDDDEIGPLVIGYVCNESPKSILLLNCAFNSKKNEFLSARVTGFAQLMNQHGDKSSANETFFLEGCPCRKQKDIQILNLPQEVEQMLLLTNESKDEKTTEFHNKALSPNKGGPDLSSTVLMYDIVEIASYAEVVKGISSVHSLESDEEDEWVLVEG